MADLEYEAKNVNLGSEKAAEALNISPAQLDYDVISHGSSGIFGLARVKNAKIRVVLPEKPIDAASLLDRLDQELRAACRRKRGRQHRRVSPRLAPGCRYR